MPGGVLTQAELDMLMALFGQSMPRQKRTADAGKKVAVLKETLETRAALWAAAFEAKSGYPATVTLRTILRVKRVEVEETEILVKESGTAHYFIMPAALVNLVNERSLGAFETLPMLSHPLSAIDRALFLSTGDFLSKGLLLAQPGQLPQKQRMIEAHFDVALKPLLRTTMRMVMPDELL